MTLNDPHCRMLEKRMVVKAVAEERKKRMGTNGSIGCEGAKEKERDKNASDRAAQNYEEEDEQSRQEIPDR